jgi:hypothetical protein
MQQGRAQFAPRIAAHYCAPRARAARAARGARGSMMRTPCATHNRRAQQRPESRWPQSSTSAALSFVRFNSQPRNRRAACCVCVRVLHRTQPLGHRPTARSSSPRTAHPMASDAGAAPPLAAGSAPSSSAPPPPVTTRVKVCVRIRPAAGGDAADAAFAVVGGESDDGAGAGAGEGVQPLVAASAPPVRALPFAAAFGPRSATCVRAGERAGRAAPPPSPRVTRPRACGAARARARRLSNALFHLLCLRGLRLLAGPRCTRPSCGPSSSKSRAASTAPSSRTGA